MNNVDTMKRIYLSTQQTLEEHDHRFEYKYQHLRHSNSECYVFLRLRSSKWCTQSTKEYYAEFGVGSRSIAEYFGSNPQSSFSMVSMRVLSHDGSSLQKPWIVSTESDAIETGTRIAIELIKRWPTQIKPLLSERGMCDWLHEKNAPRLVERAVLHMKFGDIDQVKSLYHQMLTELDTQSKHRAEALKKIARLPGGESRVKELESREDPTWIDWMAVQVEYVRAYLLENDFDISQ